MLLDQGKEHVHNWVFHSVDDADQGDHKATNAKVHFCDNHRLHANGNPAFECKSIYVEWPDGSGKIAEIGHAHQDDTGTGHPLIVGSHVPPAAAPDPKCSESL